MRANVWIKEKDLEAWNALANKSEWISDRLNNDMPKISKPVNEVLNDIHIKETGQPYKPTHYKPTDDWGA